MIIAQTPYRISLFGGGTDFEDYYKLYGGEVIGTTINKYCYVTLRDLPPFFKHKHRFIWSKIENVNNLNQIKHPLVKSTLKYFKFNKGIEVHYDGDLPGNSGIGSSSSFCVGLINAIYSKKKTKITKKKLSDLSYHIENKIMNEYVGRQDQTWAAYGGFNHITFSKKGTHVSKILTSENLKKKLFDNLLIFFTGKSRYSNKIEKDKQINLRKKIEIYHKIKKQVKTSTEIIKNGKNINDIGYLLDEYWSLKKQLSNLVSPNNINEIYKVAKSAGALGGKLIGSGGSGFFMFYCDKNKQKKLINTLNKLQRVHFKSTDYGSRIIFNNEKN